MPFLKIFDALKYFVLYILPLRIGTDPVRTALEVHYCPDGDWTSTALQDGLVSYDFISDKRFDLEKEILSACTRARYASAALESVELLAIRILY